MKAAFTLIRALCAFTLIATCSGTWGGMDGTDREVTNGDAAEEQLASAVPRQQLIQDLAAQWADPTGEPMENLVQVFSEASTKRLLRMQGATRTDEMIAILLGAPVEQVVPLGSEPGINPLGLGDLDRDFVYTPVTPCRIVDTRPSQGGPGAIPADGAYSFVVHGNVSGQGGDLNGCASPRNEPRAVHLNIAAVPVSGNGNLQPYPYGSSPGTTALVNYRLGTNISNAGTIQTCYLCGPDVTIRSNVSSAHIVVDVLGYYHEVEVPEMHYASIGDGGFIPRANVDYYTGYQQGGTYAGVATDSNDYDLWGAVQLPHGATVTSFSVLIEDNSAGDLEVWLARQVSSGYLVMAEVSSSGTPGVVTLVDDSISSAVVDNQYAAYGVAVIGTNWPGTSTLRIKRATIEYTLDEL
jgi:hypothetical protein